MDTLILNIFYFTTLTHQGVMGPLELQHGFCDEREHIGWKIRWELLEFKNQLYKQWFM
jgi:hypothetical protein